MTWKASWAGRGFVAFLPLLSNCGPAESDAGTGGTFSGGALTGGASTGGSAPGGAPSGGTSASGNGGQNSGNGAASSGGGAALPECTSSLQVSEVCESVSLEMPAEVTLRPDSGPWDTTMQGTMAPGTYVLTDLAKHGEPPTCSRTLSAIYVFGDDGYFAHGWDEGTHSIRYSGTYQDGPVDGTVTTRVDCPAVASSDSGGIPFRMTEIGFAVTNNDGTVYTFSRR